MDKLIAFLNKFPLHPDVREEWAIKVSHILRTNWIRKFMAGQAEHKGDLGEVPVTTLLDEAENEILDLYSYLAEIKRRYTSSVPDDVVLLLRVIENVGANHQFSNMEIEIIKRLKSKYNV